MASKRKVPRAILHLPENEQALRVFEKRIADFYVVQVEKKLTPLPKKGRLEILQALIDNMK